MSRLFLLSRCTYWSGSPLKQCLNNKHLTIFRHSSASPSLCVICSSSVCQWWLLSFVCWAIMFDTFLWGIWWSLSTWLCCLDYVSSLKYPLTLPRVRNTAPHSTVKAFKRICLVLMNNSPFSLGSEEPLSPVTGAIKAFQPWANAAVTSVYCCISQAWISEAPQLTALCCGYCAQLCPWFPLYSQRWQLLTDLTLVKLAVECPAQWFYGTHDQIQWSKCRKQPCIIWCCYFDCVFRCRNNH